MYVFPQQQQQQKQKKLMSWTQTPNQTLLYKKGRSLDTPATGKVAAFDIDWCVIRTKSRRPFAVDPSDWEFWCPSVRDKLRQLPKMGYQIVFFTNQAGLLKSEEKLLGWTKKIDTVVAALGLDNQICVLAALQKRGAYRKPRTGMWHFFASHLAAAPPAIAESFFVGDAAGRPKAPRQKKDFSCSDLKFALNLGLRFFVPEQYFLGSSSPRDCDRSLATMGFNPKQHWKQYYEAERQADGRWAKPPTKPSAERATMSMSTTPELVLIVGSPASGKSTLALQTVQAHPQAVRVNQDTLKTLPRCLKAVGVALDNKQTVLVDNTNRDKATRARYVQLAAQRKVPCRCVWLQTTKEESFHLNGFRGSHGTAGETGKRQVPDVVLHTYFKRLEPPKQSEGFASMDTIGFVPGPFRNQQHFEAFYQFYN